MNLKIVESSKDNIDSIVLLGNNSNVSKHLTMPYPFTKDIAEFAYDYFQKNGTYGSIYDFLLGEVPIGQGMIYNMDLTMKSAYVGLWIGENYQAKGNGLSATNLLLDRTKDFGIETVLAEIDEDNTVSLSLFEKLGFERVGISKRVKRRHGVRVQYLYQKF